MHPKSQTRVWIQSSVCVTCYCSVVLLDHKTSLSEDLMSLFPTHLDFGNSAEEFYLHETLSTPMKLLSSLFINIVPYQHN
jgi:hypothetical protein